MTCAALLQGVAAVKPTAGRGSQAGNDTVRIIDSFSYNGELVVELRLKHLYPVVDEFVITEARETHSGKPKMELFIDRYRSTFQPYMSKARRPLTCSPQLHSPLPILLRKLDIPLSQPCHHV